MRGARVLAVAAAAVLVFLAADTVFAQEDTIIIKIAGKPTPVDNVKIGRETYRTVRYKVGRGVGGSWQEESTENVVDIIRRLPQHHKFTIAQNARKDGNWTKAVQTYVDCIKHERQEWIKTYSQFYLGECHRFWGQSDPAKLSDAIKHYEVFLSKYSDHRFVPAAYYGKALAASAAGQAGKAKSAFDTLGGGQFGRKWEIRGQFGSAQMSGGSAAVKKFESLIPKAKREGMNDIVAAARLGLAKALLGNKNHRKAMEMFKDIVADPKGVGKGVLAAAHNGLGDCYAKLGTSMDDQKKALFEYLKVVVLYASARGEYLSALKKAISLLEKIGGDEYKKRANDLKNEYEKASRGG